MIQQKQKEFDKSEFVKLYMKMYSFILKQHIDDYQCICYFTYR